MRLGTVNGLSSCKCVNANNLFSIMSSWKGNALAIPRMPLLRLSYQKYFYRDAYSRTPLT